MLPLSVAIVACNEADRLPAALSSVAFADDVVVVDGGSSDDTVALARSLGARVIVSEWQGFAAQKNKALDAANHDWVLCLDADERVSPELAAELAALRVTGMAGLAGAWLPRLSWWMGAPLRHGTWYPDRQLRLVDRRLGRWGGEEPHARIGVAGATARLQAPLLHHPYRDLAEHLAKIDRYSAEAAAAALLAGRRAMPWDLAFRAPAHLAKSLLLRGGLRDGPRGLAVALLGASYVQLKWLRIWMGRGEGS